MQKHVACSAHRVYISQAEDVQVDTGEPITILQKIVAIGMTIKQTAKVAEGGSGDWHESNSDH